jgi:hypothetical protein
MKALLLALPCLALLVLACGGDDFESSAGGSSGGASSVAPDLGPEIGAPDAGGAPSSATALPDRLVVTTDIDLEVMALRQAYVDIGGRARALGGFVADAQIDDDGERGSAFLRLRVPAPRHDELVDQLRSLSGAEVKHEQSTAKEVTAEYTDLRSRVVNLSVAEAQYQELLDRAGTIEEVLLVTAELDDVRGDIEQLEGRIKLIEDRSDFATVAVRLNLPPTVVVEETPAGLASPVEVLVDAFSTSLTVAHAALNVAVVLFVAGVWIVPATLVTVLAWRRLRRPFEAVRAWLG